MFSCLNQGWGRGAKLDHLAFLQHTKTTHHALPAAMSCTIFVSVNQSPCLLDLRVPFVAANPFLFAHHAVELAGSNPLIWA